MLLSLQLDGVRKLKVLQKLILVGIMKTKQLEAGAVKLLKGMSSKIIGVTQQLMSKEHLLETMTMIMTEEILRQGLKGLMMIIDLKEEEAEEEEVVAEVECLEETEPATNVIKRVIWLVSVLMLIQMTEVVEEEEVEENATSVMSKVIWLENAPILILTIEVVEEEEVEEAAEPALTVIRKVTFQESVLSKVVTEMTGLIRDKEEKMEAL